MCNIFVLRHKRQTSHIWNVVSHVNRYAHSWETRFHNKLISTQMVNVYLFVWYNVFLRYVTVTQLQQNPLLGKSKVHYDVQNHPADGPILSHMTVINNAIIHFTKLHFNIIFSYICLGSLKVFFLDFFQRKWCTFHCLHACYTSYESQPSSFSTGNEFKGMDKTV
jgi:hypothetical protein